MKDIPELFLQNHSNNSMKDIPELLESLSQNHSNNNSEVKIKIDSKTSETSEDADREEMKWQNKGEQFITDIMDYCDKQSNIYNIESHKCKKKYNLYSIPTIIIPLLLAVVFLFYFYILSIWAQKRVKIKSRKYIHGKIVILSVQH